MSGHSPNLHNIKTNRLVTRRDKYKDRMENEEKQNHISEEKVGTGARQRQVSESPSVYGAHAAVQPSSKDKRRFKRSSIVGAAFSVFVAIVLLICSAVGLLEVSAGNCALLVILLVVLAGVLLVRGWLPAVLQRGLKIIRPVIVICAILVGLCLVEIPSNTAFLSMGLEFFLLNLLILTILFAIIYFIGQRSRIAVLVFLLMCLALGTTDYFLIEFKGMPIMPSDLSAISTAFSVAGGYSYDLGNTLVTAFAIFLIYCILLALIPKIELTLRRAAVSCGIAVVIAVCCGYWVTTFDIEDASGHVIDTWDLTETYSQYGAIYCFAGLVQDLTPMIPEGYSDDKAEELLEDASTYEPEEHEVLSNTEDLAVVVVMNETFADLSTFPYLEGSEAYPSTYYEIAEDSLEAGTAFASVFAGGTCNSEFEFLTGSNMSFIGRDIYPYTSYDLAGVPNLASYFSSYGYATHAIHPGPASNWNRAKIYEELGFDDFSDETCFEGADTLRDLVTDRETYDYVLDLLDEDEGSQFIFDVTIQNHGGYDVGTISQDEMVSITLPDGTESSELDEYASSIQHSDADLAYFVDELDALDRPVLLCFFGDHQPEISTWLYEETHGEALSGDNDLEAEEELREVPYFIWANESARGSDFEDEDASDEGAGAGRGRIRYATANEDETADEDAYEDVESEELDEDLAAGEGSEGEELDEELAAGEGSEGEELDEEPDANEGRAGVRGMGTGGVGVGISRSGIFANADEDEDAYGGSGDADTDEEFDEDASEYEGYDDDEYAETDEYDEDADDTTASKNRYGRTSENSKSTTSTKSNKKGNKTNEDEERHEYVYERVSDGTITSLSFLGTHMVDYIGLPLTNFQKFLLKTNQTILAMDYYGYLANDRVWRYYGWGAPEEDILNDYAIVQYYNLFG